MSKLFIQDKLLVNIALQTLPRHLYDTHNTEEDSSYISTNTNGTMRTNYSESPSRSDNHQHSNHQNSNNRRGADTDTHSHPLGSNRQQSSGNTFQSHTTPPGTSRQSNQQDNHNSQHSSTSATTSRSAHSTASLADTLPYISPEVPRQSRPIIPETSSDLDEEPLFTRQNIIDRRKAQLHLQSSNDSSTDDINKSSAENSNKSQRLTTLEKLRLKKQQQRLQQTQQ